jgi:hypothetical protein
MKILIHGAAGTYYKSLLLLAVACMRLDRCPAWGDGD